MSDFTSRIPNEDQLVEQLFDCLIVHFLLPVDIHSSVVAAFLHVIRTEVKMVPREKKVAQNILPGTILMIQPAFVELRWLYRIR